MSKGRLGKNKGSVNTLDTMTCMVCPSGTALASASMPMAPAAPARFSTMKGWFQRACKRGASRRAMTSGVVAAVCASSKRTGRDEIPCACAENGTATETAAPAAASSRRRRVSLVSLVSLVTPVTLVAWDIRCSPPALAGPVAALGLDVRRFGADAMAHYAIRSAGNANRGN